MGLSGLVLAFDDLHQYMFSAKVENGDWVRVDVSDVYADEINDGEWSSMIRMNVSEIVINGSCQVKLTWQK